MVEIPAFWAGVGATILVEVFSLVLFVAVQYFKDKKKGE